MTHSYDGTQSDVDSTSRFDRAIVGTVIAGRYRIDERIAAGGMATVFLAEDLKHARRVALKVLHPTLAHTIGVQRFLREIEVIARLQHPHLLTLIDSGDVDGLPYYVMPYVAGQSLREYLAERKQLSFTEAVRITQEVAHGLRYANDHSVVHRDIKPSNILMSDGHAMVADFGIATALQRAAVGRITETGISLGSPTYMSPEQAAGERDVDARSDIYSLACVLFEMLANHPPIDNASMQQVVTRKLTDGFTKLHELRPDVPPALEAAVHRALSADREARFSTMEEFSLAIAAALPAPRGSRRSLWLMAAGILVVAGGAGVWLRHAARVVRATQQVMEVSRLVTVGDIPSAFRLGQEILRVIPNDSTLRRIRPDFSGFLSLATVPANARVSIRRLNSSDSGWTVVGNTPIDSVPVLTYMSGGVDYKIRIEHAGYEPVEILGDVVASLVPSLVDHAPYVDTLRLDSVGTSPGMVRIPGEKVRGYADFHIGKMEVTNREYARFVSAGGYEKHEYWAEPMLRNGKVVRWEDAMLAFRDSSGKPAPSTWTNGTFPAGQEDYPVGGVSYYEAAAYARFVGKRLPTVTHWRRAALINFRESGWTFLPASNVNGNQARSVGKGNINPFGLYDVAGNVREWCVNAIEGTDDRAAMGGGWDDPEWLTGNTLSRPAFDRAAANGFRLVSLAEDETVIGRLSAAVKREYQRDFRGFKAVSDAEFSIFRSMHDYDHRPLDAKLEAQGERDWFRWQKVSFTAGYGGERMMAYVALPKDARPPFETVVLWPPGSPNTMPTMGPPILDLERLFDFLPHSGRALVMPVFKGSYERDGKRYVGSRMLSDSTTQYRDLAVQWIKDMRRTIDYIETRTDLRADRLGYYGVSWGGLIGPMALAVEPRIRVAVLTSGGYYVFRPLRPEVDPANYAPRVRIPVLMLNGAHDNTMFPTETSQQPLFDQLGTPTAEKDRREASTAGHFLPRDLVTRSTLEWFDRYLRR